MCSSIRGVEDDPGSNAVKGREGRFEPSYRAIPDNWVSRPAQTAAWSVPILEPIDS
jgi:hypothetical protein